MQWITTRLQKNPCRFLVVTLLTFSAGCGWIKAAPNIIDARTPSDTPLEYIPNPTIDLGKLESGANQRRILYPDIDPVFPEWRNEIPYPKNPFFNDAILSFEPRFLSFHRDNRNGSTSHSTAFGGVLGLESGWWRDSVQIGLWVSETLWSDRSRWPWAFASRAKELFGFGRGICQLEVQPKFRFLGVEGTLDAVYQRSRHPYDAELF